MFFRAANVGLNNYLLFTRLIFNFANFLNFRVTVDYIKQFVIPFGGLKPGTHQFDYEIDDLFFDHFEYSEIKHGRLSVRVSMEKEEKLLVFQFSIDGEVTVHCDRCYEPFEIRITGKETLIVKHGAGYYEENEDIQVIPEGETHFDISTFIYEYIHLLLPVRRVHPVDEEGNSLCDPDIIKRIDQQPSPPEPDPRWEVLKKLKTKN
jgi:uncharacterized protein